jgi:hypothetical protein
MRCYNPSWVFPTNTCIHHVELATTNNLKPPTHLCFRLLHCCATKSTASHSSMCISDRESRSPDLSSSVILHRERENKVFGKRSSRLLNPLHQALHHGSFSYSSIARRASSNLPQTPPVYMRSLGIYCY